MEVTSKAVLVPKNKCEKVREIVLVKEKLARGRLISKLDGSTRKIMDKINQVLSPMTRLGHQSISNVVLSVNLDSINPSTKYAWFKLRYRREDIAWWRMDKSLLDQFASAYYGSVSASFFTPLRKPNQSEMRLVKRLMLAAIEMLPELTLELEELDIELCGNEPIVNAPIRCDMHFPSAYVGDSMALLLSEPLLAMLAEQPYCYRPSEQLAQKLKQRLLEIPITARVELGQQQMSLSSLNQLDIGDIFPISMHTSCPVMVGKRPLYFSTVHAHEGQLVGKLTQEVFQPENSHDE